jgi:hypothetical protein
MRDLHIEGNTVHVGKYTAINFQRTLRIPDDGGTYPLPPGLGRFPIRRVSDFESRVPESWAERGGVFLPMYQREAMWLAFEGTLWHPTAVKVGIGGIDAISGKTWNDELSARPQNYVVIPHQPWLDGINAGKGFIRQFVAMPLGMGYTVEAQLTGKEDVGGIQIAVFEPKPGRFPDEPPVPSVRRTVGTGEHYASPAPMAAPAPAMAMARAAAGAEMGLGAGGRMRQEIYPDRHGVHTWQSQAARTLHVHIANSMMWREITGEEPPPTPVTARTYTAHGLPWFDLYDDHLGDAQLDDVEPSAELAGVKSVKDMDQQTFGKGLQDDDTIAPGVIRLLRRWTGSFR